MHTRGCKQTMDLVESVAKLVSDVLELPFQAFTFLDCFLRVVLGFAEGLAPLLARNDPTDQEDQGNGHSGHATTCA